MAATPVPMTEVNDEQAQLPQSKFIPDWREICSSTDCSSGNGDTTAASSTASPASESSKRFSPSEDDSSTVSYSTSPASSITASAASFVYESESEEGSSADERSVVDSDAGDGDMTGTGSNEKNSKAEVLEGP